MSGTKEKQQSKSYKQKVKKSFSNEEGYEENPIGDISDSTIRSDKFLNISSTEDNIAQNGTQNGINPYSSKKFDLQQVQNYDQAAFRKQNNMIHQRLPQLECLLCSEENLKNQLFGFTKCDHLFCLSCSLNFIKSSLKQFTSIICPVEECGAPLDGKSVMLAYLTADELEKLEKIYNQEKVEEKQTEYIKQQEIQLQISEKSNQEHRDQNQKEANRNGNGPQVGNHEQSQDKNQAKQPKKTKLNFDEPPVIRMTSSVMKPNSSPSKTMLMSNSNAFIMKQSPSKAMSAYRSKLFEAKKQENRKREKMRKEQQEKVRVPLAPEKLFKFMSSSVWSNSWSRFFLMLPISILVLAALIVSTMVWVFSIAIYFLLVWMIFIPIVWAIDEIWNCFVRSVENPYLRMLLFLICLFGLPLILIFFYFVTSGIIFYYSLFKRDMGRLLQGKVPLFLSCRKVHLNERYAWKPQCRCKMNKRCDICRSRRPVLCCLII